MYLDLYDQVWIQCSYTRMFQPLSILILREDTVATTSHPEMETQKPTMHGWLGSLSKI